MTSSLSDKRIDITAERYSNAATRVPFTSPVNPCCRFARYIAGALLHFLARLQFVRADRFIGRVGGKCEPAKPPVQRVLTNLSRTKRGRTELIDSHLFGSTPFFRMAVMTAVSDIVGPPRGWANRPMWRMGRRIEEGAR